MKKQNKTLSQRVVKIYKNNKKIIFSVGIIFLSIIYMFGFNIFGNENEKKYENTVDAYFAGGCFWCLEGIFESQDGVQEVVLGYIGDTQENANYNAVASGQTKHREAVKVVYAPDLIDYATLVELFWTQIDPTDEGGQFADRGFQYTTAIYFENQGEKNIATLSKKSLQESGKFESDIVTPIISTSEFFRAGEYHQDYYKKASLRYNLYKKGSGRADFIEENWKERINEINSTTYSTDSLKERLTPLQYHVTQQDGTEPAFNNEYWDNKQAGIYVDVVDGTPLYSSLDKFDSGTGWPSFTKGINEEHFITHEDTKFFMVRTEVRSLSSNSHLGHIFNDAPAELGGVRHCINSAALRFIPVEDLESEGYEEYIEMFE